MLYNKRLIYTILVLICLMLSLNVVKSVVRVKKRDEILHQTIGKLNEVKEENGMLQRKLVQVESPEYIELEARNALNLGREGEIMVILPSVSPLPSDPSPTPLDKRKNWQKWMGLFVESN